MVDASNPENGVELVLIGQSAINADGSPKKTARKTPRKSNLGDTSRLQNFSNNPGGLSIDMNQEFQDNYAFQVNLETDFFDTEKTVITTMEENHPKPSNSSKKKGYKLYALFVLILCLNLLINFDHGVLPAGAVTIQQDLKLN